MTAISQENLDFKRFITISAIVHCCVMILGYFVTSGSARRYIEPASSGKTNVIWARSIRSPKKTRADKLPGPIVKPQVIAKPKPKKSTMVRKDPKAKADKAREDAMNKAIAAIEKEIRKATPRPDNFPSTGEDAEVGLPSGPGGVSGILGGDPSFSSYKSQIRDVITNNFVWIQKGKLHAEITFRIDPNGNLLKSKLSKSSGNPSFDSAALRAIKRSSPLPTPPVEIAQQILREEFTIHFAPEMK